MLLSQDPMIMFFSSGASWHADNARPHKLTLLSCFFSVNEYLYFVNYTIILLLLFLYYIYIIFMLIHFEGGVLGDAVHGV